MDDRDELNQISNHYFVDDSEMISIELERIQQGIERSVDKNMTSNDN